MVFNYSKLNGRIIEMYGTKSNFIRESKTLSKTALVNKLKNRTPFTDEEMKEVAELLKFENGVFDIPLYFFDVVV